MTTATPHNLSREQLKDALYPERCAVQYAGGLVTRYCDRAEGHDGPHSGGLAR